MRRSMRVMSHATSLPESSEEPEVPADVAEPSDDSDSSLCKMREGLI